jgi:hypothetical protein
MPPLGLMPGSAEGDEAEHHASHARLDRLAPLAERLTEQCRQASRVVTSVMLRLDKDTNDVPGDIVAHVTDQNENVIYAGVTAILAQLIDDGAVQLLAVAP